MIYQGYDPNKMEGHIWNKGEANQLGWEELTLESLVLFAWRDQPANPQVALLFKSR